MTYEATVLTTAGDVAQFKAGAVVLLQGQSALDVPVNFSVATSKFTVNASTGAAVFAGAVSGITTLDATGDISTTGTGRIHVRGSGASNSYDLQIDNSDTVAYFRASRSNAVTKSYSWYLNNSTTLGMTLSSTGLSVTGYVTAAGNVSPYANNTYKVGEAGFRWSEIYAVNGTINTSDATLKTEVTPLDQNELSASMQIASEIGVFQWLDAVEKKGKDKARLHTGTTVQRAIEIMKSFGLDPMRYSFICYDKTEAGEEFSFRKDELSLFMLRGLAAKVAALEAK